MATLLSMRSQSPSPLSTLTSCNPNITNNALVYKPKFLNFESSSFISNKKIINALQFDPLNCIQRNASLNRAALSPSPAIEEDVHIKISTENGLHLTENGSLRQTIEEQDGEATEEESSVEGTEDNAPSFKDNISRRRNFAIISHPDAGKTTLTEKLLLYGGAIHEAGAVKARRAARHATSDWMELEKQRGISITSTAMVFETKGFQITLLDTPGHQDFGEDTFRTLAAADNAVMLVDAGKGLEPQTKKLFEVCRMRKLPVFTFMNKMDRPALEPLELLDQIEQEFGLATYPVSWPIGSGDRFIGLYHIPSKNVHLFQKDSKHGSKEASVKIVPFGDSTLNTIIPSDLYKQLEDEIELIEGLFPLMDVAKIHSGDLSPVFFGSAMNNFGVELFLDSFLQYAMQPGAHESNIGQILPDYPHFTGFVFKDFGEDTFRTLAAADNAVMLVDAGKGLEPQTKKLFEVCRMRKLPVFTFMNKMDRPALEPLELLDQIEQEFGLATYPVSWPIGSGDRFIGLYHIPSKNVHLFQKDSKHGSKEASVKIVPFGDSTLNTIIPSDLYKQLEDEIELIEGLFPLMDVAKIHSGDLSPVFFGSAMNNFGVELFLDSFLQYAMQPGAHESNIGQILPDYPHFTGFVFKLQANMDPKHRDKVAFVRVCSGQFSKGMKVQLARTGKTITLTRPQKLFAQSRATMEVGFAGDVIGLNNPNTFCIGDTVYTGPRVSFPGIPSFSPDIFCNLRNTNPSKYKQFQKGLHELVGEGAVQVLYSVVSAKTDPILAAIGQLQFEVFEYRMAHEYGVETNLEPLGFSVARWVAGGWPALEKAGKLYNCVTVKDMWERPVLLFRNEWNVSQLMSEKKELGELTPYALPST